MSTQPSPDTMSPEAINKHLGKDHCELMACHMSDEEVSRMTKELTDQLVMFALEYARFDESSKVDEVLHVFLKKFRYRTTHTPEESDDEANAKRDHDDMVHDRIAQLAALRELSDADMLRYAFRLQAAIGDANSPVRRTNILRGLDHLSTQNIDEDWDRAVRTATVILASMVYADYASRASQPAPLELVATRSEHEDYIDLTNEIFTADELWTLTQILHPLADNDVVINTALGLACDMRRADELWATIVDAMLDMVNRVQHARREQGETLRVIK